jgi:hypothetical protein
MTVTPEQKKAFVQLLSSALQGKGLTWRTQLLILTHGAYESGWGQTRQARESFNFFNITAGRSWKGSVLFGYDTEYTPGIAEPKKITQRWRAYTTPSSAIDDYLRFLMLPRYLLARSALMEGDPVGFVKLLGPDRAQENPPIGGYYTLPTALYLQGFNSRLTEATQLLSGGDNGS